MGFILFAAKNIFRSKLRLIFTLILLTIGIMPVAFGVMGLPIFLPSNAELMGGADFSISNMDINNNYTFSLDDLNKIQSTAGVTEATGTLILLSDVYKNISGEDCTSTTSLIGFKGKILVNNSLVPGLGRIKLIKGRLINENSYEILLTSDFCKIWNLDVGDNITLNNPRSLVQYRNEGGSQELDQYEESRNVNFTVVGIIKNSLSNGGEFMRKSHCGRRYYWFRCG